MTRTYNIGGPTNLLQNILRGAFVALIAIGGIFLLAASAAFAFFVVIGLVILGFIAFCVFWVRAKIFGKPFGPQVKYEAAKADMEAHFSGHDRKGTGPVIDAHQTPHGWSVDD